MRHNHRMIRATLIAVILGLSSPLLSGQDPAPSTSPKAKAKVDPVVARLVEAHNKERAKEGLPPLKLESRLEEAAKAHARDMADRETMSHEGGDGSTPQERIVRAGYHYLLAGENVAMGYRDVATVMQSWMDSPPHRKNILADFAEIGVARVEGTDGKPYWCADFGKPMPKFDPATASTDLVKRINDERAAEKLGALTVDPKLTKAAQDQAVALSKQTGQGASSASFDGLDTSKYQDLALSTAKGQPDADTVIKTLRESPSHKSQILGKFAKVGVGYATAEDGVPSWCVILANPARN